DVLAISATAIILVTAWSLRATRIAAVFFSTGVVALLSFMYLKYSAGPRHSGHLFVLLVASLWLARSRLPAARRPVHLAFRSAAALQVAAGVFFLIKAAYVPFSWSQELVSYVAHVPATTPVVVADATLVNYVGPVLSAYLRRPVDYVGPDDRFRRGSFMILDEAHHAEARPSAVRSSLRRYAGARSAESVLVVTSQWPYADKVGPAVAAFQTHMVGVEGVATVRAVTFHKRELMTQAEEPAWRADLDAMGTRRTPGSDRRDSRRDRRRLSD